MGSFAGRWRWLGFGCGVSGLGPPRSPAAGSPETATVHGRRSGNPPKKTMKGHKWDGFQGVVGWHRPGHQQEETAAPSGGAAANQNSSPSFFLSFLSFISEKCVPRVSPSQPKKLQKTKIGYRIITVGTSSKCLEHSMKSFRNFQRKKKYFKKKLFVKSCGTGEGGGVI